MRKRILSLLLVAALMLGILPTGALAAEAPATPDLAIATVEQFQQFADGVNGGESYEGKLVVLEANLDLENKTWTPIGNSTNRFKGTFDGKYHSISGLSINATTANVGLFGYLDSTGIVKNLSVSGSITTNKGTVGGIAGYNAGTIENCLSAVYIDGSSGNGTSCFGGIAGDNYKGTIVGCINTGDIIGIGTVGGIAGRHASATMENCYNLGNIKGDSTYMSGFAGGVAGQMRNMGSPAATMTNCYSVGNVLDGKTIGAVIGSYSGGTVTNCYYLSGSGLTDSNATPKTSDELKALASTLGDAFEDNANGYPVLVWEKDLDTSAPVKAEFPEATELSKQLSGYIRSAINAKKAQANLSEGQSLLSQYKESSTDTDWIAVTMGRYGYQDGDTYKFLYDDGSGYTDYIAAMQQDVTEKYAQNNGLLHDKKATEWQRLILAVNAVGGDPTSFGTYNGATIDLVKDGTYHHANPGWQGINGSIFGLIALDSKGYNVPDGAVTDREQFIQDILALQLADGVNGNQLGGWALSGSASDPDITAMAIQALAPYYNSEITYTYQNKALNKEMTLTVRQAVNAALDKLGVMQNSEGGYASWGTVNVESASQVLVALCSLGIDPAEDARFIKNGKTVLDNILTYRLKNGGFTHSFTADSNNPSADPGQFNNMATDQASYALVAYWRFENGMRALYDMRDEWTAGEKAPIEAAIAAIDELPAPSAENYKASLKAALEKFRVVQESERRYVSNYNTLAQAIERVGGEEKLDTEEKFPVSMTITTPPAKTTYTEGESFDPAGMVVTLTYSDNSTEAVTDYTLRPSGELTVSVAGITISYRGFTVTQAITVNEQAPWQGAGTESEPYLIQNLADLQALKEWVDSKNKSTVGVYFKMTADIDMSSVETWSPIGRRNPFRGTFDGDGHVLTQYRMESDDIGVFGTVGGTIENFGVASGEITEASYGGDRGVIVNSLSNGVVRNCWNGANITLKGGYSGAIVGSVRSGNNNLIEGCYNLGTIDSVYTDSEHTTGPVGGIVGYCNNATLTIRNCYNTGDITFVDDIGGIVGKNQGNLTMTGCYNTGKITCNATNANAKSKIHGLIGSLYGTSRIENSYYLEENYQITTPDAVEITTTRGETKTTDQMKAADFVAALGSGYKADSGWKPINNDYPVLAWQKLPEKAEISFQVTPSNVKVTVTDAAGQAVSANEGGSYTLVKGEEYRYTVSLEGYLSQSGSLTADSSQTVTISLKQNGGGTVTPPADDPLKEYREKALANLEKQYRKFDSSDYSSENWAALTAAYQKGIRDINSAKAAQSPYEENNIIAALNLALTAMQTIEPNGSGTVTVVVSVDANTLDLGYLVKPTLVEVDKYTKASQVLADLLRENGYTMELTGTVEEGFYLAGISPVNQKEATVAPFIVEAIGGENRIAYTDRNDTKLGEFDYYNMSGWMYCVNGSFPGVSAANWTMSNGEVMRWQFTVYGYGADLNGDNKAWGQSSILPSLGNKDSLTQLVAKLREEQTDKQLEQNQNYLAAMAVLQDPTATQSAIDKAYQNLSSGSSGAGSTSGPVQPDKNVELKPSATASQTGTADITLSQQQIAQAISQAKTEGSGMIVISPEIKGQASKVTVELPKAGVNEIAKQTDAGLKVETGLASLTLPASSLAQLAEKPGTKMTLSAQTAKDAVKLEVALDAKPVETLSGGLVVSLPVKQQDSGNVLVVVHPDGTETVVKKSIVQGQNMLAMLEGGCTVKVVSQAKAFADMDSHWAKEAAAFVSSRQLFQGTGETTFAPDVAMSRAMLVTVLYRLEDAKAEGKSPFADVAAGSWYHDPVTWADAQQIVNGTGQGFEPDKKLTRQQLVVMLYRYAGSIGLDTTKKADLANYQDSSRVADWAVDAMGWAVATGLVSGRTETTLAPEGIATRAEVAVILQRLVGMMVG